MPVSAKGKRFPIEITAVSWVDLLGYGSMLEQSHFNPTHSSSIEAVKRLQRFQKQVAGMANSYMKALIVNDGVAFVRQLSPRTTSVTYDFLTRSYNAFKEINSLDLGEGYPGARMVLATGPRMRVDGTIRHSETHLESLIQRLDDGVIEPKQALREAFAAMHVTGSVPELQANFAFTRAYLADEIGSKGGFGGANMFVDKVIFDSGIPPWVEYDETIEMDSHGIKASFIKIKSIDIEQGGQMNQSGVRAADSIADALSVSYR
jgi:hypothetical protein